MAAKGAGDFFIQRVILNGISTTGIRKAVLIPLSSHFVWNKAFVGIIEVPEQVSSYLLQICEFNHTTY